MIYVEKVSSWQIVQGGTPLKDNDIIVLVLQQISVIIDSIVTAEPVVGIAICIVVALVVISLVILAIRWLEMHKET